VILRVNDAVFFPACALLAVGMISLPLIFESQQQSQNVQSIIDNGIVAEFDRLQSLVTGPGITSSIAAGERGNRTVMVSAQNYLGDLNITPSAGGFVPLSAREIETIQGHVLRVSFFVEQGPASDTDRVNVGVFQRGIGQNGWQLHDLPRESEPIVVRVTPPLCDAEYIFIGVWPDALGERGAVQLNEIRIEILDSMNCGDQR